MEKEKNNYSFFHKQLIQAGSIRVPCIEPVFLAHKKPGFPGDLPGRRRINLEALHSCWFCSFLIMLGNIYETEICFCDVAVGVARIGRDFPFETTLGKRVHVCFFKF